MDDFPCEAPVHALGHPFTLMTAFAAVVFNGLLDKYPNVRWGFLEGGVAWVMTVLERFQGSYEAFMPINTRGDLIQLPPGERMRDYLRRQFQSGRLFVGCEGDEPAIVTVAKEIGPNALIFSSDFPHEVNNEICKHEIHEMLECEDLTDADKENILHGNAERFYNLTPAAVGASR